MEALELLYSGRDFASKEKIRLHRRVPLPCFKSHSPSLQNLRSSKNPPTRKPKEPLTSYSYMGVSQPYHLEHFNKNLRNRLPQECMATSTTKKIFLTTPIYQHQSLPLPKNMASSSHPSETSPPRRSEVHTQVPESLRGLPFCLPNRSHRRARR